VEFLLPFCAFQTLRGPVDATGFFFRCQAEGELTGRGDGASGHRWFLVDAVAQMFSEDPEQFDWLTRGAISFYLRWRERTRR
jgi:8-oxo-dGTP diphosphatase